MVKFTDLVFRVHPVFPDATHAIFTFPNGYEISVVTGELAYTNQSRPYEVVAMLHGNPCYDTPIMDNVLGYQTPDDITKVMARVAALPTPKEE